MGEIIIDIDLLNENLIVQMALFCEKYNIRSFYLLCKYSRLYRFDWYRLLVNPQIAIVMNKYLKSRDRSKLKDITGFS